MTRLIDANAFKKENERLLHCDFPYLSETTLEELIDEAPTIDAEPVRHGKNIGTDYDETDQFVCSECGFELQGWYRVEHDEDDGEETYHEYRLWYCPHCGTRIDGK